MRWRIIHKTNSDYRVDERAKVKARVGSIVDTQIPLMIARYTIFVESQRVEIHLNPGRTLTGTEWQELRAAVRQYYKTGHYCRKPLRRARKPAGKPWGADRPPPDQPAPRLTRMP